MRLIIGIFMLAFVLGCQSKDSQQAVVARVGSYIITEEEFDDAYKNSAYGQEHNPFYRSAFEEYDQREAHSFGRGTSWAWTVTPNS